VCISFLSFKVSSYLPKPLMNFLGCVRAVALHGY
jgi:hypothetical protein